MTTTRGAARPSVVRERGSSPARPYDRPLLTRIRYALLALTVLALLSTSLLFDSLATWSLQSISVWTILTTAVAYLLVLSQSSLRFWSMSSLFFLTAACFHEGLLLYSATGVEPTFDGSTGLWFGSSTTKSAALVVDLGLLAFAVGVGVLGGNRRSSGVVREEPTNGPAPGEPQHDAPIGRSYGLVGFSLLLVSVLAWFGLTVSALGIGFPLRSYEDYLSATEGQPLPFIFFGIGIGAVLASASGDRRWRKYVLVVFAAFAIAALPIGLRGEVLFPTAAAAAIYARTARMPRRVSVVVLVIALLTGISVLQQVRQSGLGSLDVSTISATPLRGVAELGSSMRTVNAVIEWRDADGFGRGGETYTAPFDRAIRGRLLGEEVPSARSDMRLLNVEMRARETTIGGSFIAEAYRNFGVPGVLIVPSLLGLALGGLDRRRRSVVGDAFAGVILVALLQHVRNSFAPTPAQIAVGAVVVGATYLLSTIAITRGRDLADDATADGMS